MLKAGQKQMKQSFIGLREKLNVKKYAKREKAITLIALVITIIVLLILADPHIFLNIPQ